jgi:hypothetical protein
MVMRGRFRRNQLPTEIQGCRDHDQTESPMMTLGRPLPVLPLIVMRDRRPEGEFLMMKLVRFPRGKFPIAMPDHRGAKFPMIMRKTGLPMAIRDRRPMRQLPIS